MTRYSPCFAISKITFSDDLDARWSLSSSGAATLYWNRGGETNLLYKNNKWLDPYKGMYDDEFEYDENGNPK